MSRIKTFLALSHLINEFVLLSTIIIIDFLRGEQVRHVSISLLYLDKLGGHVRCKHLGELREVKVARVVEVDVLENSGNLFIRS